MNIMVIIIISFNSCDVCGPFTMLTCDVELTVIGHRKQHTAVFPLITDPLRAHRKRRQKWQKECANHSYTEEPMLTHLKGDGTAQCGVCVCLHM